jgi:hypothetical protein
MGAINWTPRICFYKFLDPDSIWKQPTEDQAKTVTDGHTVKMQFFPSKKALKIWKAYLVNNSL